MGVNYFRVLSDYQVLPGIVLNLNFLPAQLPSGYGWR